MHLLSSLRMLHHLDLSSVDLSKAIDWLQVINTLLRLSHVHFSGSKLPQSVYHSYKRGVILSAGFKQRSYKIYLIILTKPFTGDKEGYRKLLANWKSHPEK
ncbi:receptor like protein 50 [Artemisia annua]|uniref:Receptor like protein 50 n=1 Tax=Artemisia annua TaxID=35608 RepID=A0A2U1QHG1_ARTAN|nr:receptor like protein 50 [Artemisia annua]